MLHKTKKCEGWQKREHEATSKFDETVKADDGWLFLGASESKVFPANLAVSLHQESKVIIEN